MERVTGIGGVFIKAKDPSALAAWYEQHLGIAFGGQAYTTFTWENKNDPAVTGCTVFSFFKQESKYFDPSPSPFMVNFRVKDLNALLEQLKAEGVTVMPDVQEEAYGKFGWIVDPEGNKIELWEPIGC